jgi:hypothetical protein
MRGWTTTLRNGGALAAAIALTTACGNAVVDVGSGGHGGGGGGHGGTGPTCPAQPPSDGDYCPFVMVCNYEVAPGQCQSAFAMEARCLDAGGYWFAPTPASCGPLSNPTCDPIGNWTVTYDWSVSCVPSSSALSVTQSDAGVVYVTATTATLSADGCTLVTHRMVSYEDTTGGFFSDDLEQALDFSTIPVTGPVSYECVGECACDGATGTATAVKVGG